MAKTPNPRDLLPLKPASFHILLALANEPRHGYAIRSAVDELTAGGVKLYPATLYGTIRQLLELKLVVPVDGVTDVDDDARRRYYQLTEFGRAVLRAETARLHGLVEFAQRTRALGDV